MIGKRKKTFELQKKKMLSTCKIKMLNVEYYNFPYAYAYEVEFDKNSFLLYTRAYTRNTMVYPFFVYNDIRKLSNRKYSVVITYYTVRNGQIVHVRTTKCKTLTVRYRKQILLFFISHPRKVTRNRNKTSDRNC